MTHNDNDFTDPKDRVRRNFRTVLTEVTDACRRAGATPVGATFADITDLVRAQERPADDFTYARVSRLTG